jgi:branched-chain amino acid transport system substrate-binding protein
MTLLTSRWLRFASAFAILLLLVTACSSAEEPADDAGDDTAAETDAPADDAGDEPTEETDEPADDGGDDSADANGDGVLQLGVLGQCEGPFGGFHEDVVGGVVMAMVTQAGATVGSTTSALDGWEGAEVAGTGIELVGVGCGDDTADTILTEIRRLVEQDGAEVIIGPLSGDEGIAVAEYTRDNPDLTTLSGIAGSQEPTLEVQAPNYFRFHGEGAIWNAGLGDILHNEAGWDTIAVIADFCGAGGEVVSRVFPPLGTTDYSSFVQQLPDPDEVDGYFWVVGGTGTQAALEAFINAKGDLTGDQHAGNLFFNPGLATALGTSIDGAYVGGFATLPGDVQTDAITEYLAAADEIWESLPTGTAGGEAAPASQAAGFGFFYGYYSAGVALVQALEATGGDTSPEALQGALAELELDLPYGTVALDENRSGIVDTYVAQLVDRDGEIVQETRYIVPGVDQSFGGTFSGDTPPPGRDFPGCEAAELPWHGNEIPVVDGVPQPDGPTGPGSYEEVAG